MVSVLLQYLGEKQMRSLPLPGAFTICFRIAEPLRWEPVHRWPTRAPEESRAQKPVKMAERKTDPRLTTPTTVLYRLTETVFTSAARTTSIGFLRKLPRLPDSSSAVWVQPEFYTPGTGRLDRRLCPAYNYCK